MTSATSTRQAIAPPPPPPSPRPGTPRWPRPKPPTSRRWSAGSSSGSSDPRPIPGRTGCTPRSTAASRRPPCARCARRSANTTAVTATGGPRTGTSSTPHRTRAGSTRCWPGSRPSAGSFPAVVTRVGAKEAAAHVRGEGEVVLPFEGMEWARPHVGVDRRGPAPEKATDVLAPGDLIRVLRAGERWELAQIPTVQGALVAMDPEDGAVLAMAGGFDYLRSKFNRGTQARRQPGSSFKPFIYASALARGFTAASLINDAPVVFDDPALEAEWRPENYSGKVLRADPAAGGAREVPESGLHPAVARGRDRLCPRLRRAFRLRSGPAAPQPDPRPRERRDHAPRVRHRLLGARQRRVRRASLVRRAYREPAPERRFSVGTPARVCRDCPDGTAEKDGTAVAPRVLPAGDTWILHSILRDVVRRGTGRKALVLGRGDLAGKTGTTNNQHDAWFCGFVPGLAAVAWVGFDDHETLGRNEVGGRAALPMWIKFHAYRAGGCPGTYTATARGARQGPDQSRDRSARRCFGPGCAVRDVPGDPALEHRRNRGVRYEAARLRRGTETARRARPSGSSDGRWRA